LYAYPLYDSTGTIYFTKVSRLQDFNSGTDNPDFPARWYAALYLGLATFLAPMWGRNIGDFEQSYQLLGGRAAAAKEAAKNGGPSSGNMQFVPRIR
jgi:hypothetical protein